MIKANKLKSYGCVIIGNEEIKENKVIWKNMESGFQEILDLKEINEFLEKKKQINVSTQKIFSSKPAQIAHAAIKTFNSNFWRR